MTVSSTTVEVVYTGNGATTAFAVTFPFYEIVVEETSALGVVTTKTVTTHYTVAGGDGATGTVTMLVAPASGTWLTVRRVTIRLQETDYADNDSFAAETHEDALDRLAMINAEQDAKHTAPIIPSYTATQIADITHAVNTTGKKAGRVVFDTTNTRVMVATGVLVASTWVAADASVTVTPA